MLKLLASLLMVVLLTYIAYSGLSKSPLSSKESLEQGLAEIKGMKDLSSDKIVLLGVQLAIQTYIGEKGEAPDSLSQLVPDYLDEIPNNPKTGKQYRYKKDGKSFKLGAEVDDGESAKSAGDSSDEDLGELTSVEGVENFVNPNTMEIEEFTYNADGKRDPFEPFDFSLGGQVDMSKPPLERYELGQLRITAILEDSRTPGEKMAIVEDATGRGYTVRKGTKIGHRNGVIVNIESDRINVLESYVDFTGKEVNTPVVMKVPPRNPESRKGGKKKRRR